MDEITEGHGSGGPGKSKRSKLSKGRQLGSKAPEDEDVNLEEAGGETMILMNLTSQGESFKILAQFLVTLMLELMIDAQYDW